jgi:hypothetical protein
MAASSPVTSTVTDIANYRRWIGTGLLAAAITNLVAAAMMGLVFASAGIDRHGGGDGNALHRRGSDPRWPRVMRWRL